MRLQQEKESLPLFLSKNKGFSPILLWLTLVNASFYVEIEVWVNSFNGKKYAVTLLVIQNNNDATRNYVQ